MEVKVDRPAKTVTGAVAILLILVYNLALLAGVGYLVYYKDASAWLFVLAMVFGVGFSEKDKEKA